LTILVCGGDGSNSVESVNSSSSSPKRERFPRTLRDELAHCEIRDDEFASAGRDRLPLTENDLLFRETPSLHLSVFLECGL
jgi:hypothetical protein